MPIHIKGIPFKFSKLRRAIDIIVGKLSFPDHCFCFFIDGIDEFEADLYTDYWDLAQGLRRWAADSADVKIYVTSRPYEEFLRYFDPNQRIHLHELTRSDIQSFVRGVLERELANYLAAGDININKFAAKVANRADSVFL